MIDFKGFTAEQIVILIEIILESDSVTPLITSMTRQEPWWNPNVSYLSDIIG